MEGIVRHILNLYSAFFFLFYIKKPQFNPLMVYTLLLWNIFSMVSQSAKVMMWATIILIFPAYFLDFAQAVYTKLKSGQSNSNETLSPFDEYSYFILLSLGALYLGLTLLDQMGQEKKTFYHDFI